MQYDMIYEKAFETTKFLSQQFEQKVEVLVILGSGLGAFADRLEKRKVLDYKDISNFPVSTVEGHEGKLIFGNCNKINVVAMQGRFHYYEGYSLQETTFPIRVAKLLGINKLIITNSAGGINPEFFPGDLMIISDHINMMNDNPLRGPNDIRFGTRFPDMTRAYDQTYQNITFKEAEKLDIKLQKGVYAALSGPNFETPAEIYMLANMGIDAVGMSTVPEVIVARHMNMNVLGISCIANIAGENNGQQTTHNEVLEVAQHSGAQLAKLIQNVLPLI